MKRYFIIAAILLLVGVEASENPFEVRENIDKIENDQNTLITELNKASARKKEQIGVETKQVQQDRFEVSIGYEYLDPSSLYGAWKSLNLAYYQKVSQDLTLLYQAGLFNRDEGSGGLFALGAYKDWTPSLYTFSQISAGSNTDYLPKIRLDHDFYYKFGEKKEWVGILGLTYIDYHDVHKDTILSLGMTYYAPTYNITYRHFFNQSDPGNISSGTDLLSIGYGKEKDQWTYFDISYGNQAYQSLLDSGYSYINEDALNVKLTHRRWTDENSGWFGSIGYFDLDHGYKKYLFQVGYFIEF